MFVSGTYQPAWGTRPEMLIGGRDWERYMYKHTLNITENVAFIGNDLLLYLAEFGQEENLNITQNIDCTQSSGSSKDK